MNEEVVKKQDVSSSEQKADNSLEGSTAPKEQKKLKEPKPALNFLLIGAGSMFTSMVIAGFLVGYVLDELFDTKPLFLLGCAVLGFIGGIQKVHKLLSKMDLMYEAPDSSDNKDVK